MTREDVLELLASIKVAYPSFNVRATDSDIEATVNLWHKVFEHDDPRHVNAALMAYIANNPSQFAPVIGQIRELMRKLIPDNGCSEMELWNRLDKAICNSQYDSVKEYNKLPDVLRRFVGSPAQLRTYANMSETNVNFFVRDRFFKFYAEYKETHELLSTLPPEYRSYCALMGECRASA